MLALQKQAMAAWDAGHFQESINCVLKMMQLQPTNAQMPLILGRLLCKLGKRDEAVKAFRRAQSLDETLVEPYLQLGSLLSSQAASQDEAKTNLLHVLELDPSHLAARCSLGTLAVQSGDMETAEKYFRETLSLDPKNIQALSLLAHIHKIGTDGANDIEQMEAIVADSATTPDSKAALHYALAKTYDAAKSYDQAFAHFQAANQIDFEAHKPTFASIESFANSVINVFSKSFFESFPDLGDPTTLPVFIVGMPRSGSTLTEQILSSHPDVYGAGELNLITRMEAEFAKQLNTGQPYPECMLSVDEATVKSVARMFLEEFRQIDASAVRVVDKMTSNFFSLGLIGLCFPNAKIIHVNRDPIDNCLSCYFNRFAAHLGFTTDLGMLVQAYEFQRKMMNHWYQVLPSPILTLHYEELVRQQEETTRTMLDYCGLDWDEKCLDYHKTSRNVRTSSNWQVRRPLYHSSIGRWKNYEKHLGTLINAFKADY